MYPHVVASGGRGLGGVEWRVTAKWESETGMR